MKRRVVEIFLDEDDENTEISIDFNDDTDFTLVEKLGIIEWAKSVILKTVEIENALSAYYEGEL